MAGEILINKSLDFLLDYGLLFLVLLLIYEGIKLLTIPGSELGPVERKVRGAGISVGKGLGKKVGKEFKGALKSAGILGKDIDDIKQDLKTQKSALRATTIAYNGLIINLNNLTSAMKYKKADFRKSLPAIYKLMITIKQNVKNLLDIELSEQGTIIRVKKELEEAQARLNQLISGEDETNKLQYQTLLTKVEQVLDQEKAIDTAEKNIRARLSEFSSDMDAYLEQIRSCVAAEEKDLKPAERKAMKEGVETIIAQMKIKISAIAAPLTTLKNQIEKIKI